MPDAQAVRISAQLDFAIVRLTPSNVIEKLGDAKIVDTYEVYLVISIAWRA